MTKSCSILFVVAIALLGACSGASRGPSVEPVAVPAFQATNAQLVAAITRGTPAAVFELQAIQASSCGNDSDCKGNGKCSNSKCGSCGNDSDCGGNGKCSNSKCGSCGNDSDCSIGKCSNSKCGSCGNDSDCKGGSCSNSRCSNAL